MTWLDRWICGLTGHRSAMLHFQQGRMALKCHDCGFESAGWQVTARPQPTRPLVHRNLLLVRRAQTARKTA